LFAPGRGSLSIDADGKITLLEMCDTKGACERIAVRPDEQLRSNPEGGFDIGADDPAEPPSRVFAFRTADGNMSMFVKYSTARGFIVAAKQKQLTLPAVDSVSNLWDFSVAPDGSASPLGEFSYRVTAADAVAGSFTRLRASDRRIDSFKINDPQLGMRSRAASTCSVDGAPLNCAGTFVMPLPGTGVSVYAGIAPANFFGIAVTRP
jgi:hypothetical protein